MLMDAMQRMTADRSAEQKEMMLQWAKEIAELKYLAIAAHVEHAVLGPAGVLPFKASVLH